MEFFENYHNQRAACWPAVERFFGFLPPDSFQRAVLLKTHLGLNYSDSGQFRDVFTRSHDHPLLFLHFWLLDDWNETATPVRRRLEKHLLPAGVLTATVYHLWENIPYDDNIFDESFLGLIPLLLQEAWRQLVNIFPASDPFWQRYKDLGFSEEGPLYLEAQPDPVSPPSAAAFAQLSVAITGSSIARSEEVPVLVELVGELNQGLQLYHELLAIRRDIYQNRPSGAVSTTMALAGINHRESVSPQQLMGAFILHGAGPYLCDEALAHIQQAQFSAAQLRLPTFEKYLTHLARLITDLKTAFTPNSSSRDFPKFLPYRNALTQALTAAESYLLADRLFQSSWAIQRGLASPATLTARAFPTGLVVENLCRCHHSMTDVIDQIFSWLQASRFRYYDNFPQLPPDADDLGLLLRLHQFAERDRRALYQKTLEQPLLWMQRSILPTGEIPVWFGADHSEDPSTRIWGHSCATTEINLLLGLVEFDATRFREIIQRAFNEVIERLLTEGLAASLYYVQPYAVWSGLRLLERGQQFFDVPQPARSFFAERFETLAQSSLTPQTAAFLILSQGTFPEFAFDLRPWFMRLLKNQRHDGSWEAESLFLVPHPSGVAWYASRLVTSSYCYLALKQCV